MCSNKLILLEVQLKQINSNFLEATQAKVDGENEIVTLLMFKMNSFQVDQ